MSSKNTFSRALRHLNQITEGMPTNNTQGLMTVGDPSQYIPPEHEVVEYLDFDKDNDADNGENTDGIFLSDGTILTVEPPGDTSYVLGPMSSMWYAWGNFTRIGYIRQSDRKMVNLGSITGELGDWDGESNFTSYGQLTLEQAVWFKNIEKKDGGGNDDPNYRAFYPGPPSNTPDAFGRYLCVITGKPKDFGTSTPGYTSRPEQGASSPSDNFSAQQGRGRDQRGFFGDKAGGEPGGKGEGATDSFNNAKDGLFDNWKSQLGKLGLNILRGFTDAAQFAGDYMFKGLKQGVEYLPDFTGAAPSYLGGKKWADIIPFGKQLAGSNYAGQYFTPSYEKAMQYAKEGGTVVAMPRTPGVKGWKNWLGSDISRGFGYGDIEKYVKQSDAVANKNLTKIINLSDEGGEAALKALASKGAKTTSVLARLGRAVPFLNAGLVAADVTNRMSQGDTFGAVLGAVQIIPGPIGWISLAAQAAYDVDGHFNKNGFKNVVTGKSDTFSYDNLKAKGTKGSRKRFGEEYIIEQEEINTEGMGQALIDAGLPKDKNEFIREMGVQLTLQGLNPQFVSIILLSLAGKPLSSDQENWVKENIEKIANMYASVGKKSDVKESASLLIEDRKRILREIKTPYKMPEVPTKFKVKPKVRVVGGGLMKDSVAPPQFSSTRDNRMWRKYEYNENVRASQEKKNQVLELIGEGDHQWNYMLNNKRWRTSQEMNKLYGDHDYLYDYYYGGKKHKVLRKEQLEKDFLLFLEDEYGVKSNILQSELNDLLAYEKDKEDFKGHYLYETEQNEREKNFDTVNKLKSIVGKIKRGDIGPEYPNEPPPEMVNGYHPDLVDGKQISNRYNKLDPASAKAMPKTGNSHIDAKIEKAKNRFSKGKSNKPYLEGRNFFTKRFKEYRLQLQEQPVNWTGGVYTQLQGPTGPVDVSSSDGGEEATYSDFTQGSTTHNSLQSVELAPRGAGTNASDGFSIGPESGNAYLGFDGQTMVGEDRVAILDPIDATKLDTITIQVIVGNNSNGGTTPTYADDGAGLGLEWYPPNGYSPFAGAAPQDISCPWYAGVDEEDVMVLYDADTDDQKGYVVTSSNASSSLKTYTVSIPPHLRRADLAIGIKQYGEWNSEEKELNYGVSRISYQNRTISSVQSGISLDTPGASAFIRVGQGTRKTDPKKRRKEVFEKLKASRKYTDRQFGEDFPGSGAQLIGDDEITPSPTTSQQVRDAWGGEPGEGAPSTSQRVRDLLAKDSLTTPELEQLFRLTTAPKLPFEGPAPAGYQAKADRQWSSLNMGKKEILSFFQSILSKQYGSRAVPVPEIFAMIAAADNAPNFGAMSDGQFGDYFSNALFGRVPEKFSQQATAGLPDGWMYKPSTSSSEPSSSDSEPWSMDIQVGDDRIVKKGQGQSGTTVLDTQRGIDNTKPQTVPSDSYVAGVDYKQPSASDRGELTKTDMASVRPTQIKKAIKDTPEVANAFSKLGTAGKTYVDYLTGNLPKVIDNKYLGKSYVNSIFKNAQINNQGTVTAGDNIVGTGGKAKYNSKTGEVSIPFNYDFKPNEQEFNDPSKAGQTTQFQRAVLNALGPYSADAQIPMPTPLQPLQTLSGVIAGGGVALAKQFGGAKHTKGRVTMPASKLKRVNPSLYNQVVKESLNESRLKSPKQFFNPDDIKPEFPKDPPPEMVNGYHPDLVDGQEVSKRFNKLDPTSAKAMPKTGNPHIDAKVEKAKNNPDKDSPQWRKKVDAKARKARLQRG